MVRWYRGSWSCCRRASWSRAIELTGPRLGWKRGVDPDVRKAVEIEAFLRMGLDEQLRHCLRPEELPDSALDDVWEEVNAHLGTSARSLPELVEQLGESTASASARASATPSAAAAPSRSRRRASAATSTPPI